MVGQDVVVAAVIAAFVVFVVIRHIALRRVAAGNGRAVWIAFAPSLVIAVGGVLVMFRVLASNFVVGLLIAPLLLIHLYVITRMLTNMSTRVGSSRTPDEVTDAVIEPVGEAGITMMAVILIGGVIAVVVLIAYGVTQVGR